MLNRDKYFLLTEKINGKASNIEMSERPIIGPAVEPNLGAFYSEHHGWLFSWLRRKLGDSFVAADLAQDTFVSVITANSLVGINEPRSFLATIARRLMANRYRRQLLERAYLEALAALPEALTPSLENQFLALEALQQIDTALDGLPPLVREAFLLVHLEGFTYAQIAERLQISSSSVKQYLARANRHCLFSLSFS